MNADVFMAALLFALVSALTPGPNNVMLMASGANFGFRRTLPHMAGITFGFPAMLVLVGLGVMQVFDLWPQSYVVLKVLSVVYLLWLAWRIAHAAPPEGVSRDSSGKPLSFLQAAAFQWVNPKAWSMGLSAITLFATQRDLPSVLLVAFCFFAASLVAVSTWTMIGQQLRRLLSSPTRLRVFNWTMAALLLASLYPVLITG